eukprot:CAMPEP_0197258726 /NCGR_PEP_ID=MMETSP1429-20130617/83031_1 /TAXON_ID=49237 /ORGANISM="Chaetoceros  sp., Strain UNC1202" /LENGTH=119 /DNA_ID=CAMNT_0042722899 /DNA_START=38 /DNA_END=397 /DNA_ORIENTATION=+
MKTFITLIIALLNIAAISGFAVQPQAPAVNLDSVPSASQMVNMPTIQKLQQPESFNQYLTPSSVESSSNTLSLKERPPPPSAEEIAAKKRSFNLWFWGGGFIAPFLATFYYFGLKFWEK